MSCHEIKILVFYMTWSSRQSAPKVEQETCEHRKRTKFQDTSLLNRWQNTMCFNQLKQSVRYWRVVGLRVLVPSFIVWKIILAWKHWKAGEYWVTENKLLMINSPAVSAAFKVAISWNEMVIWSGKKRPISLQDYLLAIASVRSGYVSSCLRKIN